MKYSASFKIILIALFTAVLAACSSGSYRAPVVELGEEDIASQRTTVILGNGPIHRVNEGESLYAIAWMYDFDYQALALANNIREPYTIFPGQELSLDLKNTPAISSATNTRQTQTQTISRNATGNAQTRPVETNSSLLRWVWPAQGNIVGTFSSNNNENKGIDIAGNSGDPVLAAESGEVVYAGSGLLRYGELVIIKHNDQFLSAYAHNSSINVNEGDRVSRGQQIANLGSTGIDRNMLHFEIRLAGSPVDPQAYLPPR